MSANLLDLVTVKPLGWLQNGAFHRANSYAGIEYEIEDVGSRFQLTTRVRSKERIDFFSTLESAKAFAQANFDARILSALATPAEGERT